METVRTERINMAKMYYAKQAVIKALKEEAPKIKRSKYDRTYYHSRRYWIRERLAAARDIKVMQMLEKEHENSDDIPWILILSFIQSAEVLKNAMLFIPAFTEKELESIDARIVDLGDDEEPEKEKNDHEKEDQESEY